MIGRPVTSLDAEGQPLTLDALRDCFEGMVPATLATVDPGGVPNVSFISQVHYVDSGRIALSYQFFNKTRRNILSTRSASVEVIDPLTIAFYQLDLDFETTESDGPVFEVMKARLAGIASHTGMEGVFRLMGADIFRVRAIRRLVAPRFARPLPQVAALPALRRVLGDMARATALGELYDLTLDAIARHLGITNLMILVPDEPRGALDAVASWGYPASGIGAEVRIGDGVIGVAARERVAIRIDHMSSAYLYTSAVRDRVRAEAGPDAPEGRSVPFPGLSRPESQIALPILWQGQLTGVLFAESPQPMRFLHEEEDTLGCIASALAAHAAALGGDEEVQPPPRPLPGASTTTPWSCATTPPTTVSLRGATMSSRASPGRSCGSWCGPMSPPARVSSATANCAFRPNCGYPRTPRILKRGWSFWNGGSRKRRCRSRWRRRVAAASGWTSGPTWPFRKSDPPRPSRP